MIKQLRVLVTTGALLLEACGALVQYPYPLSDQEAGTHWTSDDYPCPIAEQIAPCICTFTNNTMEMDCSAVESEEQLNTIFHSSPPLPYTRFTKFTMNGNEKVTELLKGIFNHIRFENIKITNGALKFVELDAFMDSASILKKLTLYGNQIERFFMNDQPDMTMFTQLWYLHLGGNEIVRLPDIQSNTITELHFKHNPIDNIYNVNFKGVPNVEIIDISRIGMKDLRPYSPDTTHQKLREVYINNNKLDYIGWGALQLLSPDLKLIDLQYNSINDVHHLAFDLNYVDDVTYNFTGNNFVVLQEDLWKPLVQNGASLDFTDNPLLCGCDIAWFMLPRNGDDTDYLGAIRGTCPQNDNISIADLDPAWYATWC